MMDLESLDHRQKHGGFSSHAAQQAEVLKKSKVLLLNEQPQVYLDRNHPPAEISIKVSVFNFKHGTFDFPACYFISSDSRLTEMVGRLKREFQIIEPRDPSESEKTRYYLFFENIKLDDSKRFAELGFLPGDHFYFCPKQYVPSKTTGALKSYTDFILRQHNSQTELPPTVQQAFFYMKDNQFFLKPSYSALCRMSFFELGNIHGFTIENKHGRIQFLDPVDLRHCNLSEVVRIEPNLIEVYPEGTIKPKPTHGLNVKAHLFFYNLKSQKTIGDEKVLAQEFEAKLRKWVMGLSNTKFLKYDPKSYILQLEVSHF